MPNELSLRRIAEHHAALGEFNNAYVKYLEAGPSAPNLQVLRNGVLALIPRAQEALNAAGIRLWVESPPIAPRRIVYDNLASMAFLHEQGLMVFSDVPQHILDSVRVAAVTLQEKHDELVRRRRRPLYWLAEPSARSSDSPLTSSRSLLGSLRGGSRTRPGECCCGSESSPPLLSASIGAGARRGGGRSPG